MIEDNPIQSELEELVLFTKKYKHIYIWGCDHIQQMIAKYMFYGCIKLDGYLVNEKSIVSYEKFPVFVIDKSLKAKNNTGIIISSFGEERDNDISKLESYGFRNFYSVSEWNCRTIPYKMTPRSKEKFWVEVNLADHCNLNCQCCDHFSPIACPTFLDFDQYVKDLNRLSELTDNKIGLIKLQGGEPLLNDRLIDFIRVTRQIFPEAFICLFTAGLQLKSLGKKSGKDSFWNVIKDCEIEVRWTRYPINLDHGGVKKVAEEHGVEWWETPPPFEKGARVWLFSEIGALNYTGVKHSCKHPFWLKGGVAPFRWISCYQFNESIVLRDGKIYTCPMIPYVKYFNEYYGVDLKVTEEDYIDIYKANSFEEISEFCTHRVPFCTYCAVHHRYSREWKQSKHDIEEWTESTPFFGDTMNPYLKSLDDRLFLMKLGFDSLRKNGLAITLKKTVEYFKNELK